MTRIKNPQLEKVYGASNRQESQAAYDEWAATYDNDLQAYGYRVVEVAAEVWDRFVPRDAGTILDAGCGTGLQAESLHGAGFEPIVGIDLSEGMLNVARRKNIYAELHRMALGERLAFADNSFANTISVGTITPGHAPPHSFDELIRVTEQGGLIVFSLRVDDAQDPAYLTAIAEHEKNNRWTPVFESEPFVSMPVGEPEVINQVFVVRVA